jgi:hypothetical protein
VDAEQQHAQQDDVEEWLAEDAGDQRLGSYQMGDVQARS